MHHSQIRFTWKCIKTPSLRFMLVIVGITASIFHGLELKAESKQSAQNNEKAFPIQKKWGTISALPQGLKLDITQSDSPKTISIPRMNNRIQAIYLARDTEKKPLKLKPGIKEWEIQLPPNIKLTQPISVIVEFKEPPYLPTKPKVIQENQKQEFVLDAKDAIVHGKMLRFEPQPYKNTVGYWVNEKDWCEWKINPKSSGIFNVYLLQGCGRGQGGSIVKLSLDQSDLQSDIQVLVEETGHFQNFKERHIGKLMIDKPGIQSLQLKPQNKANKAIMDVRKIRLVRQSSDSP